MHKNFEIFTGIAKIILERKWISGAGNGIRVKNTVDIIPSGDYTKNTDGFSLEKTAETSKNSWSGPVFADKETGHHSESGENPERYRHCMR